ncbi:hypothetical protein [Shinella sp. JR1-6]|uniref:hypothetical protein n=1 Tax=Shinella sp. JR1-6 TaxID=2527671 RepID=UPI00102D6240|nr:hypothetical protein [Shinella sp. JR1-6]TAA50366.1 hypothetical protein EXZ48_33070 [Shinella sp. JR1-6]
MAVTTQPYNHTATLINGGTINLAALKVMLLSDSASFTAANTELTQVTNAGAFEVSGNGWTAGGRAIANATVTTVETSGSMLDADDIEVTATGGPIGPAYGAVVYDDSDPDDAPLFFINFDGPKSSDDGIPFVIRWSSNGIWRVLKV